MARRCDLTGKATKSGNNRPFSLKITKRKFRPNLFKKKVVDPATGRKRRVKLSAKAIRTLKKWAREAYAASQEAVADATPKAPKVEKAPEKKAPAKKKGPGSKSGKLAA